MVEEGASTRWETREQSDEAALLSVLPAASNCKKNEAKVRNLSLQIRSIPVIVVSTSSDLDQYRSTERGHSVVELHDLDAKY